MNELRNGFAPALAKAGVLARPTSRLSPGLSPPLSLQRGVQTAPLYQPPAEVRRRKLWEFSTAMHCSIIGTCLTVGELRKIVAKSFGDATPAMSDHEIHQRGVALASVQGGPAKLLQKALDIRHARAIRDFERADSPEAVRRRWAEARRAGDIAGGYWAALTHPQASGEVVRAIFGDVHMLSHLVGAANRADIAQLAKLEEENSRLAAKVERQEARLRASITERDREIARLQAVVAGQIGARQAAGGEAGEDEDTTSALESIVGRLQMRLSREEARRESLEARLAMAEERARNAVSDLGRLEARERQLGEELDILERFVESRAVGAGVAEDASKSTLNLTLLYVGGPAAALASLRDAAESTGATFLHHDGGQEEAMSLLHGLIGKADVVAFPMTCVSHAAVAIIKRDCRQAGKSFLALAGSGAGALLRALRQRADSSSAAERSTL